MKISTVFTLIFFLFYFIYKLFGNNENDYWVCTFWLVLSSYLGTLSLQLANHSHFFKMRRFTWIAASIYWFSMSAIHTFLLFYIDKYKYFADKTNKYGLGATIILFLFLFLIYKIYKNDSNLPR